MTATDRDVLLPEGTRLLHIGPHKTGTTTVQSAFHLSRAASLAQGVRYAGPTHHATGAAQAAAARGSRAASARPIKLWNRLLREIRSAPEPRVVISSEWFADADDGAMVRIVRDLDPARVHVVVTLRPLARILPSQWQQFVAGGSTVAYDAFLDAAFNKPDDPLAAQFWRRHRHGRLVARWAKAVRAPNVTVIVADDRERGAVLRAMERLTGLEQGTLVPEDARANRSLTWPEVEVIRAINVRLAPEGLSIWTRQGLALYGAAAALRQRRPADGEPSIETAPWAIERASAIAWDEAAAIGESRVRVIGDLISLSATDQSAPDAEPASAPDIDPGTWADIAGTASVGLLRATGLTRGHAGNGSAMVDRVPTARLASILAGRARTIPTALVAARQRSARQPSTLHRSDLGRDDEAGPSPSPSSAAEGLPGIGDEALAAFRAAFDQANYAKDLYDHLVPDILAELRQAGPTGWAEAIAAISIGIARASGLLPGGSWRRTAPPRALVETPEIVELSSPQLARLVAARTLRSGLARVGRATRSSARVAP